MGYFSNNSFSNAYTNAASNSPNATASCRPKATHPRHTGTCTANSSGATHLHKPKKPHQLHGIHALPGKIEWQPF